MFNRSIKIESPKGWFYLSVNATVYHIHLSIGRFAITFQRTVEDMKKRRTAK